MPPLGLEEPPPNYHQAQDHRPWHNNRAQDHRDWNHNRDQGELVGRYHNSSFWGREEEYFHPSDVRFANDTYRSRHDNYRSYSEYHHHNDVPCRGCGRINCTCTRLPPNPSYYRHDDYHHSNGYG